MGKLKQQRRLLLNLRSSTGFILTTVGIGQITDLILYGLIVPVLPYALKERVGTPDEKVQVTISGLLAAYAGASVLCSPFIGYWADRSKSRKGMFLGGLIALLGSTILFCLGRTLWLLIVARILQGASAGICWSVGFAIIQDTVGMDDLGKTIGTMFGLIEFGDLASPTLGGVIYHYRGYYAVFAVASSFIVLDILFRLVMIEKSVAEDYYKDNQPRSRGIEGEGEDQEEQSSSQRSSDATISQHERLESDERTPMLRAHRDRRTESSATAVGETTSLIEGDSLTKLPPVESEDELFARGQQELAKSPLIVRMFPIIVLFNNRRLLAASLVSFTQAAVLGGFDATIPVYAKEQFAFKSLEAGLIFLPLQLPPLLLGPLGGYLVDRHGPKLITVWGLLLLSPLMICLSIPRFNSPPAPITSSPSDYSTSVAIYACILAGCGICFAMLGSPALVEGSVVVKEEGDKRPGFFGRKGAFGQFYSLQNLTWSAGLMLGPEMAGVLKDAFGYLYTNIAMAVLTSITALIAWSWFGGTMSTKKSRSHQ